ncbi:S-adenosyl-L-methionine-dependent methyltransferase, partial [Pilobolus umbonatus]
HYFLKKVWNGIYQANLKDPGLIIHWGCGMGVWPMEMATLFPTCKVIGIDYEDAISSSLQHHLPNLEFMFISINGKLTGLEQIPSNSADYIMIRDVWLFITPSSEWDIVLDEAFRILKDGGLIEITEHLLHINSPGPETKKLESWFDKLYESLGADKKVRKSLKKYMAKAGFISIDTSSISVPLGEWAASKSLKESGYLIKDIMQREIRSLKKWIEGPNNISDTEFNQTVRVSMEEEVNEYRSTIEWVSVTGRKPGTHANIKINVPEFS